MTRANLLELAERRKVASVRFKRAANDGYLSDEYKAAVLEVVGANEALGLLSIAGDET